LSNKVILIILDGYGKGKEYEGNAIYKANTPFLDNLEANVPHTLLKADSEAVGLPANTMGGSEVGHYTMGAGQIVMQSLPYINNQIESGQFFENKELLGAINHAKENNSSLHLVGMISDAGVHSHIDHLYALIQLAKKHNLTKVYIHAIADGRDVPERSALDFINQIEQKISTLGLGEITDVIGRYYAMDRDENWERTEQAYKLYTLGDGEAGALPLSPLSALTTFYQSSKESDYYLPAQKTADANTGLITGNDSVIFFNYRTDRAKQLTDAFTLEQFDHFKRDLEPLPYFVCFGEYTKIAPVAFKSQKVTQNLGKIISDANLHQLRIAETEKYPHVTFFFNSQNKEPYPQEDRIMIPSPKVASYAEKPEMSAIQLTDRLIPEIEQNKYDFIALNYANMDLVGHSGDIPATITACEIVDQCLAKLVPIAQKNGYSIVITGDHGNADEMTYKDGEVCPSHSMNPTQCFVLTDKYKTYTLNQNNNGLQDLAPTILELMALDKSNTMTGESLIVHTWTMIHS